MPQVSILSANTKNKVRESTKRQIGMEALRLAASPLLSKYKNSDKIKIARYIVKLMQSTTYKNWDKLPAHYKALAAELGNAITGEVSERWNPSNQNNSYTFAPQVSDSAKTKDQPYSHYDLNSCKDEYRRANPGISEQQINEQCIQSLGGFRDVAISQPDKIYHTSTTQDKVNVNTTLSRQLSNLNNSKNTEVHFGTSNRKSALQRGQEAIKKADKLLEDIHRDGIVDNVVRSATLSASLNRTYSDDKRIKSSSVEQPTTSDTPTHLKLREKVLGQYVTKTEEDKKLSRRVKGGSKIRTGNADNFLYLHQYQYDPTFAKNVDARNSTKTPSLKSAGMTNNINKDMPAIFRLRELRERGLA